MAQQRAAIDSLREYFTAMFGEEYTVPESQLRIWILQYGFDNAIIGLEETFKKISKINQSIEEGKDVEQMSKLSLVKFASWVMSQEKKKELA
jgi:hypothetical protein